MPESIVRESIRAMMAAELTRKLQHARGWTEDAIWQSVIWAGGEFYAVSKDYMKFSHPAHPECSLNLGAEHQTVQHWIQNMYGTTVYHTRTIYRMAETSAHKEAAVDDVVRIGGTLYRVVDKRWVTGSLKTGSFGQEVMLELARV